MTYVMKESHSRRSSQSFCIHVIVSSILLSFGINISITIELLFLLYNVSCLCSVFIYFANVIRIV